MPCCSATQGTRMEVFWPGSSGAGRSTAAQQPPLFLAPNTIYSTFPTYRPSLIYITFPVYVSPFIDIYIKHSLRFKWYTLLSDDRITSICRISVEICRSPNAFSRSHDTCTSGPSCNGMSFPIDKEHTQLIVFVNQFLRSRTL